MFFDFQIFEVFTDFFGFIYFGPLLLDVYAFIIGIFKEIHKSMITVGDFNILLSKTDKTIRKSIEELSNPVSQLDLADIVDSPPSNYRYRFFSKHIWNNCQDRRYAGTENKFQYLLKG